MKRDVGKRWVMVAMSSINQEVVVRVLRKAAPFFLWIFVFLLKIYFLCV